MPQQEVSNWMTVNINLIDKASLSTSTIYLSNKAFLDPGNSDNVGGVILPLIISGTRIGTASDREMILPEAGSIRIDNSIGSFGVDRKLSDLLERHEIVDQYISISYGTSGIDGLNIENYTGLYVAKVLDWSHVIDQNTPSIDIRFDAKKIQKRILNRILDDSIYTFTPLNSVGKALPFVIGENVQVKPILIDENELNPTFAYATTLSTEHPNEGVQTYYAKDTLNTYEEVRSSTDKDVAVFSISASASVAPIWLNEYAFYLKLETETTYNYIATGINVLFSGNGVADTHDGTLTVRIYEADESSASYKPSNDPIAFGSRDVTDFDSNFDAGSNFWVAFALNKPLVLAAARRYYISVTHKGDTYTGVINARASGTGSTPAFLRKDSQWIEAPIAQLSFEVYGAEFVDYQSDALTVKEKSGLGYSAFSVVGRSASGTSSPRLDKLDLIAEVNGLIDDVAGSITGSASSLITTVHDAIKLACQVWNGSSWSLGTGYEIVFDFNEYSDTYFPTNTISGATDGETSFEQWLRQVCRNTATKIVLLNNGKVAPYSWGTTRTSAATFTQENSKLIRLEQLDSSYVVNETTIAYDKALVYYDSLSLASQGISSDYTKVLIANSETSEEFSNLVGNSEDIFGLRTLADIYFNWIKSDDSATRLARYYLSNYNTPPRYIEIEVSANDYGSLEIMDVVTIINPSLPNYYGGIPNAKLPHYEGEEVDPLGGYNLCEAQSYRAQIESKTISFNEDMAPVIILVCRLLLNPNDPT